MKLKVAIDVQYVIQLLQKLFSLNFQMQEPDKLFYQFFHYTVNRNITDNRKQELTTLRSERAKIMCTSHLPFMRNFVECIIYQVRVSVLKCKLLNI
jgi:hypothetical protein